MTTAKVRAICREVLEDAWGGPLLLDHDIFTLWLPEDLALVACVVTGRGFFKGYVGVTLCVHIPEQAAAVNPVLRYRYGAPVTSILPCAFLTGVPARSLGDALDYWFEPGRQNSEERLHFVQSLRRAAREFVAHYGSRRAIVGTWERGDALPSLAPSRVAAAVAIVYAHLGEHEAAARALGVARRLAQDGRPLDAPYVEGFALAIAEGRV